MTIVTTTLPRSDDDSVVVSTAAAANTLNKIAELTREMWDALSDVSRHASRFTEQMEKGLGVRANDAGFIAGNLARFAEAAAKRDALIEVSRQLLGKETYPAAIALAADLESRVWFSTED